ncbi:MAG: AraC family transcriptional regulator ligand-binding domain-containing protein [Pseudomonadales bacterium]|nr:AraC family transcriptional regulator ligand-binding domain-containing protein [Gammaproteobacteria bacterium]MBP6052613.1 AraC family transcriptional regulator ligand-binding domain-containing protein [Pseudomonadales bacterium]MBK6582119.1 AraC family transcriptional regulator ligand-binding domain-containing protein [Gammaproteobacteria bacterium]MBK7171582.1 AraC family transcriptional regulator ligand-binding domain-containing protein [Gammaproteobacteria bacterium]MBK8307582.1 AraC fam
MASSRDSAATTDIPGLPVHKFRRLLAYLDEMGVEGSALASAVGLDRRVIDAGDAMHTVPALFYCLLYNEAVSRLQMHEVALPWGAGIGGKAFSLMAHCIISCRTLGEALQRAGEFESLVSSRHMGHRIQLEVCAENARLNYHYRLLDSQQRYIPRALQRGTLPLTVGRASGLTVWHAFCGWLIGRPLELAGVGIATPTLPERYRDKLQGILHCPVAAVEGCSWLDFPAEFLDFKLVHDAASLEDLLRTGPYQLMRMDSGTSSTSAAIRSLLGNKFRDGLPSFEDIAGRLGVSASSLRRRLMSENSSYQKLKDECRRDAAIRLLQQSDCSVADIGEQLGFTETSSFIRSFRGWTGTTPRGFRDRLNPSAA